MPNDQGILIGNCSYVICILQYFRKRKHSLFFRFHRILNIYAKRLYCARCGHKNLIQHLIPRPKEFNLGLILQKTIFWCYNARKAHAVCRRQMAAQLKLNSFQNSGFFNNRKFNQLISAGTDVSEQSAICSHTHSNLHIMQN